MRKTILIAGVIFALSGTWVVGAEETTPGVEPDGVVRVPSFNIPFSSLASPEAKVAFEKMIAAQKARTRPPKGEFDIAAARKWSDNFLAPYALAAKDHYPVISTPRTIDGVPTDSFMPKDGIAVKNKHRVLIHLHGGAFLWGGRAQREAESIPIAALGKIEVVSVDYRLGPEHKFPAASEDVAAVYRELLKDHAPQNIGIYGCSAGGMLTAEAMAWFDKKGLRFPGAIGILCASLGPISVGDSHYMASFLTGATVGGATEGAFDVTSLYFGDADPKDPLVYPQNSLALLAKFPPTLFVTGTRAAELSGVTKSHLRLIKAGVDAELYVWDGMWHGFFVDPALPESKEAYGVIVDFFDRHLGKRH